MPDRPSVHVHLLPGLIPPGALRGGVAVVVDVLRATTVMVHALANGCEAVIPCLEIDDARRVAASLPPGTAILGGERQGLPIEGFDLGNSPGDYTPEVCRGKTLVMTTTNGTRAILASLEAERVLIGAFANQEAVLELLDNQDRPVHLICSGTDGRISLEDTACAGRMAHRLIPDWSPGNDEAWIAHDVWEGIERQIEGMNDWGDFVDLVARGRGGRRVREIGLNRDVQAASRIGGADVLPGIDRLVPEVRRDPIRIVPGIS